MFPTRHSNCHRKELCNRLDVDRFERASIRLQATDVGERDEFRLNDYSIKTSYIRQCSQSNSNFVVRCLSCLSYVGGLLVFSLGFRIGNQSVTANCCPSIRRCQEITISIFISRAYVDHPWLLDKKQSSVEDSVGFF